MRVAPFGYPRIDGYVLLPAAFRSLSRPSSAPSAKASALCSSSLDHYPAYASVHMRQRRLPPSPASGCFCFMLCYLAITLDVFLFFVAQIPVESFLLSSGLFLRICGFQGAFPLSRLRILSASGDEGIRTLDPLLARQVLSQLSYTPKRVVHIQKKIKNKWA